MYEKFTDRSRKVMQLANQEAQRFNHEYIDACHILIGLAKEGSGVAANVLKNLQIDLRAIREEIEKDMTPVSDSVILGKLPHTPNAKRVVELSVEEARGFDHNYVGTEHVLLGLLGVADGICDRIFSARGLTADRIREEVKTILGRATSDPTRDDWRVLVESMRGKQLVSLPPGVQFKMVEPERLVVKVGSLEIDVGLCMKGTIKLDGVEQDWLTGMTIELAIDKPARVTMIGHPLPAGPDAPAIVEPSPSPSPARPLS